MRSKRIKHSKIRNTGLLFEFILRQITADVLDKRDEGKAVTILKKRFNENSELGKELALYNILCNKKFNSDSKADYFINEVIRERRKLNNTQLKREKYKNGTFNTTKPRSWRNNSTVPYRKGQFIGR